MAEMNPKEALRTQLKAHEQRYLELIRRKMAGDDSVQKELDELEQAIDVKWAVLMSVLKGDPEEGGQEP
jgi:hypothetical protein